MPLLVFNVFLRGATQEMRFQEQMQQLDQAHRILRDKLEASQQRQMVQLSFYYDQLELSLLSPDGQPSSPRGSASRSSTMGRSSGAAAMRKL